MWYVAELNVSLFFFSFTQKLFRTSIIFLNYKFKFIYLLFNFNSVVIWTDTVNRYWWKQKLNILFRFWVIDILNLNSKILNFSIIYAKIVLALFLKRGTRMCKRKFDWLNHLVLLTFKCFGICENFLFLVINLKCWEITYFADSWRFVMLFLIMFDKFIKLIKYFFELRQTI